MDIEKEKSVFLGIYKYYPSAIKFTFDVENECFVLSKKNPLDHEVEAMSQMNQQWRAWLRRAKLEYEKLKGCVVVPVQCPDPDFADSLFDELSKKAIGEFGDDLLIHFSDIDEEKIWALMVEAAKAQVVSEIQQSQQAEIDDLKAQLKALLDSRIEFVEYCRKMESGDFVIVDKTDLELAIDALKDASNNDDDSFAHRAKDLEKALKND